MHTPHSKDAGKYNGPKGRKFAPALICRLATGAIAGRTGFPTREAAQQNAELNGYPDATIGEWKTIYGSEFDWYTTKQPLE